MPSAKRQAASDLAEKLKLEEPFQRSLIKLFNTIAGDFEAEYISTGRVVDVDNYKIDLQAILKENYRKISKVFKTNLRDKEKASPKNIAAAIDTQLTVFINQQTGYQSSIIISSLGKELAQEVDDVIIEGALVGTNLTSAQVAQGVKKKFKSAIPGRTGTIAVTETQLMAEKSKFVEAVSLETEGIKVTKQWISTLDEVTRVAHVFADGQIQNLDEPFIVGGEQLMTPGDSSLGASLGNIINCRCDTIYIKE